MIHSHQTGAGKSYTMTGSESSAGIIPLVRWQNTSLLLCVMWCCRWINICLNTSNLLQLIGNFLSLYPTLRSVTCSSWFSINVLIHYIDLSRGCSWSAQPIREGFENQTTPCPGNVSYFVVCVSVYVKQYMLSSRSCMFLIVTSKVWQSWWYVVAMTLHYYKNKATKSDEWLPLTWTNAVQGVLLATLTHLLLLYHPLQITQCIYCTHKAKRWRWQPGTRFNCQN